MFIDFDSKELGSHFKTNEKYLEIHWKNLEKSWDNRAILLVRKVVTLKYSENILPIYLFVQKLH